MQDSWFESFCPVRPTQRGRTEPFEILADSEDCSKAFATEMHSLSHLGQVITELVSNSLKLAFPGGRKGEVGTAFRSTDDEEFELVVSDNGIGMPEHIDLENSESLGWNLVKAFANKIRGKIEVRGKEGTEVRLNFWEMKKK